MCFPVRLLAACHIEPNLTSLSRLGALVNRLHRTLILPAFKCPSRVHAPLCNICAIDDTCCFRFQKKINFNFKARVRVGGPAHS